MAQGKRANGAHAAEASKDELLQYYRDMMLIRRFEERAGQLYGMGLIGGFCHLYIGQEAVVVGMQAALKDGDQVITAYRDHGHMLAGGMTANGVMAELTGRRDGYSKGKGGSMHMFSDREGVLRRPRHRRRASLARRGPRVRQQVSRGRQGLPHLFRRRRGQPRPSLRKLQHGEPVEAAGRVHRREQSVRDGHLDPALIIGNASAQARHQLQHSRRRSGRHGCRRRARGGPARRRTRARGRGADAAGDENLPLSRPLDVRPGEISHQGRGGRA